MLRPGGRVPVAVISIKTTASARLLVIDPPEPCRPPIRFGWEGDREIPVLPASTVEINSQAGRTAQYCVFGSSNSGLPAESQDPHGQNGWEHYWYALWSLLMRRVGIRARPMGGGPAARDQARQQQAGAALV